MKNLELLVEMAKADEVSFEEFQQIFVTPLSLADRKQCGYSFLGDANLAVW